MFEIGTLARAMGPLFLGNPRFLEHTPKSTPRNPKPKLASPPFAHEASPARQGGHGLGWGLGSRMGQATQAFTMNNHTP